MTLVARQRTIESDSAPADSDPIVASVLLVDDRPANLLALEAILEPIHHNLVKANSGEEALKKLLDHDFALILMDVQMPGLDGIQTARLIRERERTRHIPIIFLTAISRDAQHIFQGYSTGAVDYLLKPFDPDILRSKVQVFVDIWVTSKRLERREVAIREREREMLEREREHRFRELTDAMPVALLAGRRDGTIYWANKMWFQYTGIALDPVDPNKWVEAIHPDDRESLEETRARAITSSAALDLELRVRRRDGVFRWFLVRAAPQRDSKGEPFGWIATYIDLDDKKRAEETLIRANEAKDAFIAAASHELRTPLAAAKAQAQLALRKLRDESLPEAKSLRTITSQIDRMAKLVEDLLDVSRVQIGRLSLELTDFDFTAMVRELAERIQALSDAHPIELVGGDVEVRLVADRNRLDQVITNLLSNAIRYSPKGGRVVVSIEASDAEVHVSVKDEGVGIPPDKQSMIFERFGRAHGSKYGGLGLGLTISQGIVEQHGGTIWVESTGVSGEGSTFHVRLPRVQLR